MSNCLSFYCFYCIPLAFSVVVFYVSPPAAKQIAPLGTDKVTD